MKAAPPDRRELTLKVPRPVPSWSMRDVRAEALGRSVAGALRALHEVAELDVREKCWKIKVGAAASEDIIKIVEFRETKKMDQSQKSSRSQRQNQTRRLQNTGGAKECGKPHFEKQQKSTAIETE